MRWQPVRGAGAGFLKAECAASVLHLAETPTALSARHFRLRSQYSCGFAGFSLHADSRLFYGSRRILSPSRLPVPPRRLGNNEYRPLSAGVKARSRENSEAPDSCLFGGSNFSRGLGQSFLVGKCFLRVRLKR